MSTFFKKPLVQDRLQKLRVESSHSSGLADLAQEGLWKVETGMWKGDPNRRRLDHNFVRDRILPEWHGWHAARRGLGTNLYRLGVPEKTNQAILRHANVSTTNTYYIKSAADDTRAAMAKLEQLLTGVGFENADQATDLVAQLEGFLSCRIRRRPDRSINWPVRDFIRGS